MQQSFQQPYVQQEEEQVQISFGRKLVLYAAALAPGMFRPSVLIVCGLMMAPIIFLGYYALWSFREMEMTGGVCFLGLMVALFGLVSVWIMSGSVQSPMDALLEIEGRWGTFVMLLILPIAAMIILALIVGPMPD